MLFLWATYMTLSPPLPQTTVHEDVCAWLAGLEVTYPHARLTLSVFMLILL